MRTISTHYKNQVNCQKKNKPVNNALQGMVKGDGSCHMLLKKLNTYETD